MRIGATLAGIVGGTKLQTARDLGIEVSPEGSITDEVIELHVAVLHRTQVSPPMVELGHALPKSPRPFGSALPSIADINRASFT
jgi:hypothetical protein